MEADAEAIRAAILLDELEPPASTARGGRIIVEVKTLNALAVLQYSCSVRVMALHTGEMNARRHAQPRGYERPFGCSVTTAGIMTPSAAACLRKGSQTA